MSKGQAGVGTTGPRRRTVRQIDLEALGQVAGRITALEEQKDPQRRSLFVDGEFVLGLDLETVVRLRLRVGQAIDGPLLLQSYQMEQAKRAWDAGLRLLATSPRTRQEVGRKLARSYPPELVEQVLERLEGAGWLDDAGYAESYIRSHRDYGARRLLAGLIRKGVDRNLAGAAVQAALGEVDAAEQARDVATKRLARMGEVDRATAQRRLVGFLARRGFGPDAIQRALAPLLQDLPQKEMEAGRRSSQASKPSGGFGRSGLQRRSSLQRRPLRPYQEEEHAT